MMRKASREMDATFALEERLLQIILRDDIICEMSAKEKGYGRDVEPLARMP